MDREKTVRPFGWRDKVGYMFGDFGNDFTFLFASTFLMIFYTKVLGISMGLVGTLFLTARCIDAFTDVTMGRIVDRMHPKKDGRFRPWLRRMCAPVAISSFLMYQSSLAGASMTVKVIYMFVTYILWGSIFYTSINIPYGSMASVLSADSDDRAALSTYRSVGATLAGLIIGVGGPMLVYTTDAAGNQLVHGPRFTLIAGIFSLGAIGCYLLCYFMTTERVKIAPTHHEEQVSFKETVKALVSNRALLGIIAAAILLLLASLMTQSVNQYVFVDYFKNKEALAVMSVAGILPMLLMAPFTVPITRKYGKKEVLKNINLQLERGKIIGLLGPNGSGKTTLIKIINGLLTADEGDIKVSGEQIGIESKKIISYLPDRTYLADWMKVKDIVGMFDDFYKDFSREKAEDMLKRLNINEDDRLKTLSKGNKEKVQLILVMSRQAQLYLLDEPIGGVDPAARDYILNTIITNYNPDASVVISTHLISDVEKVLDEAIFINNGEIVLHESVDDIREKYSTSVDGYFREVFKC